MAAPDRDVADAAPRELPETQVVVLVHQRVPAPTLGRSDRSDLDLAHDHVPTVQHLHHARLVQHRGRKSQYPSLHRSSQPVATSVQ